MDFGSIWKKYGVYVVAVVLFVVAAVVYCKPVYEGKKLYAGDSQNYQGAAHEQSVFHKETGDWSFWNSSMFCGMPAYMIDGGHYSSDDLLSPIRKVLGTTEHPVRIILRYLICFFILLRSFKVNRWLSIVGAFAISLSSYFLVIIPAGHFTKAPTIAYCAVIIAGFNYIFQKKYLLGACLTMVFVSTAFKLHPQMFYYSFMFLALMWIAVAYESIKGKTVRNLVLGTLIFVLSVGIGIGTGMSTFLANKEYTTQTIRGGQSDIVREQEAGENEWNGGVGLDIQYATEWSYGLDETFTFLIPGFLGGANSVTLPEGSKLSRSLQEKGVSKKDAENFCKFAPLYWGEQPFTSGNIYMGAVICFLFLLGLLIVQGPMKWVILVATIFSTALAWGHNCLWLTEFFFKYFPMYSKFRAVSSILVVAEVAMPLLGIFALERIIKGEVDRKQLLKSIYIAGGVTCGICLFFALFGGALFDFTSSNDSKLFSTLPDWACLAIVEQRVAMLRGDSLRSLLFIAAAMLVLIVFSRGKMGKGWLIAIFGVLIVADLWPIDRRYFCDEHFVKPEKAGSYFKMQPWEEKLLTDKSFFRVLNLTNGSPWSDSRTSYYLKSIGGYSAAKLRRYQDLIVEHLSPMHLSVINMLNTKYIIINGENNVPSVQYNPMALGNAWFVDKLIVVDNANQESDALNTIELEHEAVLDKSFASYVTNTTPSVPEGAYVKLFKSTPKELCYEYSTSEPGTIVFSEIYYPFGWKVTIDGQPADYFRADYTLRAMNVPAGKHDIHFVFDPDSVHKGNSIAIFFIILMYAFIGFSIVWGIVKSIKQRKDA